MGGFAGLDIELAYYIHTTCLTERYEEKYHTVNLGILYIYRRTEDAMVQVMMMMVVIVILVIIIVCFLRRFYVYDYVLMSCSWTRSFCFMDGMPCHSVSTCYSAGACPIMSIILYEW
jgi:predicted RND superfamily exporter protein